LAWQARMPAMAESAGIDFEAEGLLEGVEGEQRDARRALLEELAADGIGLEELREAVDAGRLALLPVEPALAGEGPRYTPEEIARESGIGLDVLERYLGALGLPVPERGERVLTEADLDAARRVKAFEDVGLPEDGRLQVARTIGMATARIAEANRELIRDTLIDPGANEHQLALRFSAAARELLPLVGPALTYAMRMHLLEQIRRDVIGAAELATGSAGGVSELAVGFADMVGFTKLGERVDAGELGQIASRLEEMATGLADPPVRVVKLIGDAAMFVSGEIEPLMDTTLRLVEAADREGEEFPQLRAGVAFGPTIGRGGDYYGRVVNLASRVTGVARPGSVLADGAAKEAADDAFHYSFAGERRLKGIDGRVKLFRVRREPKEGRA
jgi:adenylate cyclase